VGAVRQAQLLALCSVRRQRRLKLLRINHGNLRDAPAARIRDELHHGCRSPINGKRPPFQQLFIGLDGIAPC
jgi:hypothetical protein